MDLKWIPVMLLVMSAGCAEMYLAPTDPHVEPAPPDHATPAPVQGDPVDPDPHGEPDYTWGDIEEGRDGAKFTASRTAHVSNGIGAASRIDLGLIADYADVIVVPANVGSYVYDYSLTVRADTPDDARDGIEEVDLRHTDMLLGDTLSLSSDPSLGPAQLISIGITGQAPQRHLSFEVVIQVPFHLVYGFTFDADYTDIAVGPLATDSLDVTMDYSGLVAAPDGLRSLVADIDYSDIVLHQATTPAGSFDVTMDYSELVVQFLQVAPMRVDAEQDYSDITIVIPGVRQVDDDEDEPAWESDEYDQAADKLDIALDIDYSDVVLR